MSTITDSIVRVCASNTLNIMRSHPDFQWQPDSYWWSGIQLAWVRPFKSGVWSTLTADLLNRTLLERGVPAESIKQSGKHTLLELDNIAFVYRDKQYKHDGPVLQVSPHILGMRFRECGHAFVNANCSADVLVTFMLAINESIPAAQAASLEAYHQGLKDRMERAIRQQITSSLDNGAS